MRMRISTSRSRSNGRKAPRIVIHSLGSDGMEACRVVLSITDAERLMTSIQRAIELSGAETASASAPAEVAAIGAGPRPVDCVR